MQLMSSLLKKATCLEHVTNDDDIKWWWKGLKQFHVTKSELVSDNLVSKRQQNN